MQTQPDTHAMPERRLVAAMFTDVVAYTRRPEAEQLEIVQQLHDHIYPLFAQYNGRLVNTIGDGCFVLFESVLRATECAIAVQDKTANTPQICFQLRIGLNTGDATLMQNDAFGDTINLTERIMQKASPGGICMTEEIASQLRGKVDWACHSIGEHDLKHIAQPVRLCLLIAPDQESPPVLPMPLKPKPRIALLLGALALALAITGFILVSARVSKFKMAEADRLTAIGKAQLDTRNDLSMTTAKENFEAALHIARDHPLANALTGHWHIIWADMSRVSGKEAFRSAENDLNHALEIKPDCADALAGLGYIAAARGEEWNHSEALFKKAMTSESDNMTAIRWYTLTLIARGKFEEARTVLKTESKHPEQAMEALALPFIDYYEANSAVLRNAAIDQFRKACPYAPNPRPYLWLGRALTYQEDYEGALKALSHAEDFPEEPLARAYCYGRMGKEKDARNILITEEGNHTKTYASPSLIAKVYCGLYAKFHKSTDITKALEWLQTAVKEQDGDLLMMNVDPGYEPIRDLPEFVEIVKKRHLVPRSKNERLGGVNQF